MRDPQSRVPIRTIAATIGIVLLTAAVLLLGWEVRRVLTWIVVAALLAIILGLLVSEGAQFIDRVPSYVEQARTGRGPVGDLVQRYNLAVTGYMTGNLLISIIAGTVTSRPDTPTPVGSTPHHQKASMQEAPCWVLFLKAAGVRVAVSPRPGRGRPAPGKAPREPG